MPQFKKLKIALLVDRHSMARWQKAALDFAADLIEIKLVLSCNNTHPKRNYKTNLLYYALNYFSLRNNFTKRTPLPSQDCKKIEFNSIREGNWQRLPKHILEELKREEIEIIIKFGMSLLRIEDSLSNIRILSYHHGDPKEYRGRPAGFYELLHTHHSVGTVVQEITNTLDSGKVWALCYSRVWQHSYKKTASQFYANSTYILRKALINIQNNCSIESMPSGKNYKLPSNILVLKFILTLTARKIGRIIYGLLLEKRWNIGILHDLDFVNSQHIDHNKLYTPQIDARYTFYADPFFSTDGRLIRAEALNKYTGLGDIIEIDSDTLHIHNTILRGKHYSYPISIDANGVEYIIPEVASHSAPFAISKTHEGWSKIYISGLEKSRILDGTIAKIGSDYFLFCSMKNTSSDCLYLFFSQGIDEVFHPHPLNPIVIDPSRARMAGRLLTHQGSLYRFAQNNCNSYGDGITICRIKRISHTDYEEEPVSELKFKNAHGPHTIDFYGGKVLLDFYKNQFSLLAWYRRAATRIFGLLS